MSSRTDCRGLGLGHQVLGLGLSRQVLGLGLKLLALPLDRGLALESITTFSFGLSYCLHFSVNELMKVQITVVGLLFSV